MSSPDHKVDHVVEALMLARMYAVKCLRPYYATALFRMVPVATRLVPTLGVDKWWRLYYNPDLVAQLSVEELGSILVHEVEHLLRDHAGRCEMKGWDHSHFNIAGDCEINDGLLRDPAAKLPDWVAYPERYGLDPGLLAEQYYELIPKPEGGGSGSDDDSDGDGDAGDSAGQEHSHGHGHTCGSGAHGKKEDHELDEPGSGQRGVREKEGELVRKRVAEDTAEYANKHPGSVPDGVLRWAEEVLSPQVPWERELAGAIRGKWARTLGMSDYSFSRPNRRQSVVRDFVLPSLVDPTPSVAFCVDTSGSMSTEQLELALGESKGVLRALGGDERISVISVDCMAHSVQKVFDHRKIQLSGGGGTDMGEGIAAALKLQPQPDFIIVMTDGFTPWPASSPHGSKVIVVLVPMSNGEVGNGPPGWGRVIHMQPPKQRSPRGVGIGLRTVAVA